MSCAQPGTFVPSCIVDDGADGSYTKGLGTVIVIQGTFGKRLYSVSNTDPEAGYFTTTDSNTHGVSVYTVSTTEIGMKFLPSDGSFTDSFSIASTQQTQGFDFSSQQIPPPQA